MLNRLIGIEAQWDFACKEAVNPGVNIHLPTPQEMKNRANGLLEADEKIRGLWDSLEPDVDKAHLDAIARMAEPGPKQLSPNEIARDKKEFAEAIKRADVRISFDEMSRNTYDDQRFSDLVNYFKSLQIRLGDYGEIPTQQ